MSTGPVPTAPSASEASLGEEAPLLFAVTKGHPTPEELAALTAVIAAVSAPPAQEEAAAPTRRERIRQATLRPRHMIAQRRGRQ
ncbi:acyl-CoA carboxylase subunit epsilon [Sinomonas sp. ASV486]|uniref:acyl-CoA carboxylase subunit epsilon n=1 Tax=Sinomonas sp. ASV486 TaxID=3051170 RepID=UPI0027DC232C|nr:acyl-CoA carboxylase subunit epsilon [Sinomonas sp. ASV486]MDQ4490390.1 acyl-CoA carboxylase subunit epsilon [Sinomonas sp. ASV486]